MFHKVCSTHDTLGKAGAVLICNSRLHDIVIEPDKAALHLQEEADPPQGQETALKGKPSTLKGNTSLPRGKEVMSKGNSEPSSQAAGSIQPPVMLSHLANPTAAGMKESIRMELRGLCDVPTGLQDLAKSVGTVSKHTSRHAFMWHMTNHMCNVMLS